MAANAQDQDFERGLLNVLDGSIVRLYFTLQLQRINCDMLKTHLQKAINFAVPQQLWWLGECPSMPPQPEIRWDLVLTWQQAPEEMLLYVVHDVPTGILDAAIEASENFTFYRGYHSVPPEGTIQWGRYDDLLRSVKQFDDMFERGVEPLTFYGFAPSASIGVRTTLPSQCEPANDPECFEVDKQLEVIYDIAKTVRESRKGFHGTMSAWGRGGLYISLGWSHSKKDTEFYRPPVIRDPLVPLPRV